MTTSIPSTESKQFGFTGCALTILPILFAILGIYDLVFGSIIAYVFSSARMLSPEKITIVLIVFIDCVVYFYLAFRIKKQHWLISVTLLIVTWLILPLPLRFLVNKTTARVRIDGYSMGATLPNASYVLADRQAYQQNDPQRGDIVIFQAPFSPDTELLKRVIGLPGETVSIDQGQVSINGTLIKEPYIFEKPLYNGEWNVPEDQYFVLGDSRNDSKDSHQWGTLPRELISAKAMWIYFPLSRFGKISEVIYLP